MMRVHHQTLDVEIGVILGFFKAYCDDTDSRVLIQLSQKVCASRSYPKALQGCDAERPRKLDLWIMYVEEGV